MATKSSPPQHTTAEVMMHFEEVLQEAQTMLAKRLRGGAGTPEAGCCPCCLEPLRDVLASAKANGFTKADLVSMWDAMDILTEA